MIIILCGLVFITMMVCYFFWKGYIRIDTVLPIFLIIMFAGIFTVFFNHINVRVRLEMLNDFLVDNSAYIKNNSLKYYDKEKGQLGDTLFLKNINYVDKNKIQVSLSKFDEDACKKLVKFFTSTPERKRSSQNFKKEYTIKMDTFISDENLFCKNKNNKITYTMIVSQNNENH